MYCAHIRGGHWSCYRLYINNSAFNVGMGYLTVLQVMLGAKIGDLHAKDSNLFRNRLMVTPALECFLLHSAAIDFSSFN